MLKFGSKIRIPIALMTALLIIIGSPAGTKPAFAAGEILDVSSPVVEHGQRITLTVTNIVASSFCDYLPYAGEGYYAEAYIMNLSKDMYFFPPQSSRFDPRKDDSLSLEVVIPDSFPLGMAAITVDCMYPDGRQTGNTAKPFTVEVVSRGSAPKSELGAVDANAEEPVAEDVAQTSPEDSPLGLEEQLPAVSATPVPRLAFVLESFESEEAKPALVLDGNRVDSAEEIIVLLEGTSTNYSSEITRFLATNSSFREVIRLPTNLPDGKFRLLATGKSSIEGKALTGDIGVLVEDSRYFVNGEIEIPSQGANPSTIWWIFLAVGLAGAVLSLAIRARAKLNESSI